MNRPTKTLLDNEARSAILRGVNAIYEPIRRTIGPSGSNFLTYGVYGRSHRLTNDGVTGSEVIEPLNEYENLAAKAFKDGAKKTNDKAGDGTTSCIVIEGSLINNLFSYLQQASTIGGGRQNTMSIKRKLQETCKWVVEEIKKVAKKVESEEELIKIATVSTESEELGKIIGGMAWEIGEYGFIDITEGHKGIIETEVVKGARFPAKTVAKGFINDASKFQMVANDVEVVLTNYKLESVAQVAKFLEPLLEKHPNLAILAPGFSKDVAEELFKVCYKLVPDGKGGFSKQKTAVNIYPVQIPSLRTEQIQDIAIYTGARFINKDDGDKTHNIRETDLGFLSKLVVKDSDIREDAIAIGGKGTQELTSLEGEALVSKGSLVKQRIETLKKQIEEQKDEADKNLTRRRIAGLSSAVGIIRVGAQSESELFYLKKKVEDGINACKGALEEGYVKGGGLCLKEIAETLPPDDYLRPALLAPYEQIQENADNNLVIDEWVIDPAKVVRLAVEHAVSGASNLITVKMIIPEIREKSPAEGYEEIANALRLYAGLYAKVEGILASNREEIERDSLTRDDNLIRSVID